MREYRGILMIAVFYIRFPIFLEFWKHLNNPKQLLNESHNE